MWVIIFRCGCFFSPFCRSRCTDVMRNSLIDRRVLRWLTVWNGIIPLRWLRIRSWLGAGPRLRLGITIGIAQSGRWCWNGFLAFVLIGCLARSTDLNFQITHFNQNGSEEQWLRILLKDSGRPLEHVHWSSITYTCGLFQADRHSISTCPDDDRLAIVLQRCCHDSIEEERSELLKGF